MGDSIHVADVPTANAFTAFGAASHYQIERSHFLPWLQSSCTLVVTAAGAALRLWDLCHVARAAWTAFRAAAFRDYAEAL